jgi:hypothetical protein
MRVRELLTLYENQGILARILQDPSSYIYAYQDGLVVFGEDGPVDEEGEPDEEGLASDIYWAANNLSPYIHNGTMTIYRAIDVPDNWVPKTLGIYWSFLPEYAIPYNGSGQSTAILTGLVREDGINWPLTLVMQSLTEEEIRIYPDSFITITAVNRPALQHLIGKSFPA